MAEVVETKLYGNVKIVKVVGDADDTTVEFRPDEGKQWQVLDAWAYHNDSTNRAIKWQYYDGTTTINKAVNSIGANSQWALVRNISDTYLAAGPIYLSYDVYARVNVSVLTAGKLIVIEALVMEFGT